MKCLKKLIVGLFLFVLVLAGGRGLSLQAKTVDTVKVPVVKNGDALETTSACYIKNIELPVKETTTSYFKFTLSSDSWVYFSGNYSLYNHDGVGTDVVIYSDKSFSKKQLQYGWGCWRYDNETGGFLKKGTYYGTVSTSFENYLDTFTGNVNVIAGSIPVSKLFDVKAASMSNKKYKKLSFTNALGEFGECAQYRIGSVSNSYINKSSYWYFKSSGEWYCWGDKTKVKVLQANGSNKYSFKADKNGKYTIMLQDTFGNRYQKIIKVSSIDNTKPTVAGVKNNKTYKSKVTIKFSDKQSGIKTATLNGKAIKTGKKVSKTGAYTLKVTDKAGNTTTIKFKIKKK